MIVKAHALNDADWFKSSYSNDQGGNCVEGARLGAEWFKSTHSDNQGGNCVEGLHLAEGGIAIRDSKDPHGPALLFPAAAWTSFTTALRNGDFPTP